MYSGGREYHVCPFGRQEMITSRDDGLTWTSPRVLADSAIDDRDSGVLETSKGTLIATMFNSFAYQIHMNAPERLLNKTFGKETPAMLKRWRTMDDATTQEQKEARDGLLDAALHRRRSELVAAISRARLQPARANKSSRWPAVLCHVKWQEGHGACLRR